MSTAITLNDRFALIKKSSNTSMPARNNSRARSPAPNKMKGSRRNLMLLKQLEKQHKIQLANKLKNVIRSI
jgi:hypothetical protein